MKHTKEQLMSKYYVSEEEADRWIKNGTGDAFDERTFDSFDKLLATYRARPEAGEPWRPLSLLDVIVITAALGRLGVPPSFSMEVCGRLLEAALLGSKIQPMTKEESTAHLVDEALKLITRGLDGGMKRRGFEREEERRSGEKRITVHPGMSAEERRQVREELCVLPDCPGCSAAREALDAMDARDAMVGATTGQDPSTLN